MSGCRRSSRPGVPAATSTTRPLQLAIVGRPNVGKSTLVNRLIGEERLLVRARGRDHPRRDRGRLDAGATAPIRLVDTAGLRRRPRVEGKLEQLSVGDALRAIRFAETVILVIDAMQPLERQDLTIARLVAEEGRALVLAANKWDAVEDREWLLQAVARAGIDVAAAASGRCSRAGVGADRLRDRRDDDRGRRR